MDIDNKYGFKETQQTLLEIMKKIDRKFSEKNIFYIFVYGSALGAVREKGFIPWDDDIDIAILREDTGRVEEALSELEYYFEPCEKHMRPSAPIMHISSVNKNDIDPEFDIKDHPEMDIWIIDRVPAGKFKRKLARFTALEHDFFTYRQPPATRGAFINKAFSFILKLFSDRAMDKLQVRTLKRLIKLGENGKFVTEAYHNKRFRVYERNLLTDTVRMEFEDMSVPVPKDYDKYLTIVFGDYMTPPPETPAESTASGKKNRKKKNRGTVSVYDSRIPDHHS